MRDRSRSLAGRTHASRLSNRRLKHTFTPIPCQASNRPLGHARNHWLQRPSKALSSLSVKPMAEAPGRLQGPPGDSRKKKESGRPLPATRSQAWVSSGCRGSSSATLDDPGALCALRLRGSSSTICSAWANGPPRCCGRSRCRPGRRRHYPAPALRTTEKRCRKFPPSTSGGDAHAAATIACSYSSDYGGAGYRPLVVTARCFVARCPEGPQVECAGHGLGWLPPGAVPGPGRTGRRSARVARVPPGAR